MKLQTLLDHPGPQDVRAHEILRETRLNDLTGRLLDPLQFVGGLQLGAQLHRPRNHSLQTLPALRATPKTCRWITNLSLATQGFRS